MNSQNNNYTKEQIIQVAILHKDAFFEKFGLNMQRGQKAYSDSVVKNVLLKTGKNIILNVARQSGKTTINVWLAMWLMLFAQPFWEQLGFKSRGLMELGWGAPQFGQAKTGFDRLKFALEEVKKHYQINFEEANGNTLNINLQPYKSILYVFPVSIGSKIESKTLDVFFGDEAQFFDDSRLKLAVLPMLASTNGVKLFSGTTSFNTCYYWELINSDDDTTEKFIYDAYSIIEQKNEMFQKTGNAEYLNYEKHFLNELKEHGEASDYIQSQYLLKWKLDRGMFVSPAKMSKMCVNLPVVKEDLVNDIFIGIDCAKESDSTVACAWRWEMYQRPEWAEPKKCLRVLDWYVINKELYSDQWEVLEGEFLNHYKLYKLNIDGTGSGDGTGDWFLKKYDKITYDIFKAREANGRRGIVRPIKFTAQSKNVMYKQLQLLVDNDQVLIPIDPDGFGYNKFVMESKILLKKYKGDLLSVHHDDSDGATDDCWDALAMTCYDIDAIPLGSQPLKINKFTVKEELTKPITRQITEEWINKKLKRKESW